MPLEFAHKLFVAIRLATTVIVADSNSAPRGVVHPGLFLPTFAAEEARAHASTVHGRKSPAKGRHEAGHRPAKAVIGIADKSLTLLEDGHVRVKGPITVRQANSPVGNHVFVLRPAGVINRITTDDQTVQAMQRLMHRGFALVITDAPASDSTRSSRDFVIATHHQPDGWAASVFRGNDEKTAVACGWPTQMSRPALTAFATRQYRMSAL